MEKKYIVLKLPRYGLSNKIITYCKLMIIARESKQELLFVGWAHIAIGPYLRKEKNKRRYNGMLKSSSVLQYHFVKFFKKKHLDNYQEVLIAHSHFNIDPLISDISYFVNEFDFVKNSFYNLIQKKILNQLAEMDKVKVGIHIRLGDFKNSNSHTPITYYLNIINKLRASCSNLPITDFSDGRKEELESILVLENVTMFNSGNDLIDLLQLSSADAVVTTKGSSYSYWAAFLAKKSVIHHPKSWVKLCRPQHIIGASFEGVLDLHMELPKNLLNDLL